jgi:uncharacterized membrane protein YfcA
MIATLEISVWLVAVGLLVRAVCVLNNMTYRTRPLVLCAYVCLAGAAFGALIDPFYDVNLGPEITHPLLIVALAAVMLLDKRMHARVKPEGEP